MQKRKTLFPVFSILVTICIIILLLSSQRIITSIPFINTLVAPLQRIIVGNTQQISHKNSTVTQLQEENKNLQQKIVAYKKLQQDDAALRDQFQSTLNPSRQLLPAHIVGLPGFISVSTGIEQIIIDKGLHDGIKEGAIVVYKDNLIGKVGKATNGFSQIVVVGNTGISVSAKTLNTNAFGVVKGQGNGDMLLDNVLLSQSLQANDLVVTNGDLDIHGQGFPPGLVVGKIIGIEKNPSALFQRANVRSLVDVSGLDLVFVINK